MTRKVLKPDFTLSAAMLDRDLFGKTFRRKSFWTWRVLAKTIDGLPLNEPREVELYEQCTGRKWLMSTTAICGVRRLNVLAGRRAGKDRFFSGVALWRCVSIDWSKHISAGEQAVCILLGKDKKQAAILQRYCRGLIKASPVISAMVVRDTDGVIEFSNGAVLEIVTNNADLVRGRSAIGVFGSESCHWETREDASSSDAEVVAAARPSMSMCPDGGMLALFSSVFLKRGYMHRAFERHFGDAGAKTLIWFAPTRTMNSLVPQAEIDDAIAEDGPKFRAEYLNIWRDSESDFCNTGLVERITDWDVITRPPERGQLYAAYCDMALGTGKDSAALAIGHAGDDRKLIVDFVAERRPPFVPAALIAEWAGVLEQYGIYQIYGDRVAGAYNSTEWARCGLSYNPGNDWKFTTSECFLHALPLMSSERARLNDCEVFRSQVTALERRVSLSGHETVTHSAAMHDDVATAVCGLLVLLAKKTPINWVKIAESIGEVPIYRRQNSMQLLGERRALQMERQRASRWR
jgi:hypothetical protein